jgi:hypothetical protein
MPQHPTQLSMYVHVLYSCAVAGHILMLDQTSHSVSIPRFSAHNQWELTHVAAGNSDYGGATDQNLEHVWQFEKGGKDVCHIPGPLGSIDGKLFHKNNQESTNRIHGQRALTTSVSQFLCIQTSDLLMVLIQSIQNNRLRQSVHGPRYAIHQ